MNEFWVRPLDSEDGCLPAQSNHLRHSGQLGVFAAEDLRLSCDKLDPEGVGKRERESLIGLDRVRLQD